MVTVYKLDHAGKEVTHYDGQIVERSQTHIVLEARFNHDDKPSGYVTFRRGDRFIEWFYTDRWYSIFEIHDVSTDALKGWYCNISRPAVFEGDTIRADDLLLDLWVDPIGNTILLDQDEFDAAPIDEATRSNARSGLDDLLRRLAKRENPFLGLP